MSDKEWKAMYELAIEQRNQARSESARLHAENERLRAALRWIATVNAMDYEYQVYARAALKETQR